MKETIVIIILALIVLSGAFIGGVLYERSTVVEIPATVPVRGNIDSVNNVVAEARHALENMDSLLNSNAALLEILQKRPVIVRTIRVPGELPPSTPDAPARMVDTYTGTAESSAVIRGTVVQGEDTLSVEARTHVKAKMKFVGEPANALILEELSFSPFGLALPVKEHVRTALPGMDWNSFFSLHGIGGWNGSMAGGVLVNVGWLGAGVMINKSEPIWFGTFRIGH